MPISITAFHAFDGLFRYRSRRDGKELGQLRLSWAILLLVVFNLAIRYAHLGNPEIDLDEQFYFVVGGRMLHGALPYVDIWDRKPIGLFLIYALIRAIGSDNVIFVQLAGFISSVFAAYLVWRICCRYIPRWNALLPALLYLAWLTPFGGGDGQSPVFYNPLMLAAVWYILKAIDQNRRLSLYGCVAMALAGTAIQIKYTAAFEGIFFGLALMWLGFKAGWPYRRIFIFACLWAGIALLPTLLVSAFYAISGHFNAYFYANFVSIFERGSLARPWLIAQLSYIVVGGFPLFLTSLAGGLFLWLGNHRLADKLFLSGWVTAAMIGFVSIGNFYYHYALPLIGPLLILGSPIFGRKGLISLSLFAYLTLRAVPANEVFIAHQTHRSQAIISSLTHAAEPYLKHGCLFIYDGPSILYATTHSCLLTAYVYPDHLSNSVEEHSLGIDTQAEMRRILARKPALILKASRPVIPILNPMTDSLVKESLHRNYHEIAREKEASGYRDYVLYARNDLKP